MTLAALIRKLVDKDGLAQRIPAVVVSVDRDEAWGELCLRDEGGDSCSALQNAVSSWNLPWDKSEEWQPRIRERLRLLLEPALRNAMQVQEEKLRRVGLPLQFRLLRDVVGGNPAWDTHGNAIFASWVRDSDAPEEAEARWLWANFFERPLGRTSYTILTRIVVVTHDGNSGRDRGVMGTLELRIINWSFPKTTMPKTGFVPHPHSFVYCVDKEFREQLANVRTYLRSPALDLWKPDTVMEWHIRVDEPLALLAGGSAGAAVALAAGSLLAKRLKDRERGKSKEPV